MNKNEMIYFTHTFKPYRKLMKKEKMAAQFMPFAALTNFDQMILDTAKITVEEKILLEDKIEEINHTLNKLSKIKNPLIKVTYYEKLEKNYRTIKSKLKSINLHDRTLIFMNNKIIKIDSIKEISFN